MKKLETVARELLTKQVDNAVTDLTYSVDYEELVKEVETALRLVHAEAIDMCRAALKQLGREDVFADKVLAQLQARP